MDIITSLKTKGTDLSNNEYVLQLIEETMKNWIEVNKIYFFDKPLNLNQYIGLTINDEDISNIEDDLNFTVNQNFANLRLFIDEFSFVENEDSQFLDLEISLICGLMDAPKNLSFRANLQPK